MTALIDDLGIWVQLGVLNNSFEWQIFPVASSTGNTTYRVSFDCANKEFFKIKTICYLRAVYQSQGSKVVDQKWIKLYPKLEKEIVEIPLNAILSQQLLLRSIEIISRLKFRPIGQKILDYPYTISLEEFLPFPETIEKVNNIPQLTGIINEELANLKGELTQEITANINNIINANINSQLNQILILLSAI